MFVSMVRTSSLLLCFFRKDRMQRRVVGEAMQRVFPPWPRDQFGRVDVDDAALQALRDHAIQVAGPLSSSFFVRLPPQIEDAPSAQRSTITARVHNTMFLYPTCRMNGLRSLEEELRVANKQLTCRDGQGGAHRIWRKGSWRVVASEDESQSLSAAEGKLPQSDGAQAWIPPKFVPLLHCACAKGSAVLHRWSTNERFVHASQLDRSSLPFGLKIVQHYFAVSGRPLPMPCHVVEDLLPPPPSTVALRTIGEVQKEALSRRLSPDQLHLAACWFRTSELSSQGLRAVEGAPVYSIVCEEHHVCIPLSGDSSPVEKEVRDSFLGAYPPPRVDEHEPKELLHVFCGALKQWESFHERDCKETFDVKKSQLSRSSRGGSLFVDVAAAEELGLISWDDGMVRHREYVALPLVQPAPLADDPPLADDTVVEDAGVDLDDVSIAADVVEPNAVEQSTWNATRRHRFSVKAAVANAQTLAPEVLRELAHFTSLDVRTSQPTDAPSSSPPLAVAEDIAGVTLLSVCRYVAMVNAADVERVPRDAE